MGTTLTGTAVRDTYDGLIKVTDNGPLSATAKYLSDGLGNDSVLALSTGNIGIGTDSPSEKLDISGNTNGQSVIRIVNTNAGNTATARVIVQNNNDALGQLTTYSSGFGFTVFGTSSANYSALLSSGANSNGLLVGALTAHPVIFGTDGSERMRIDSTGNVGIGTSSPAAKLDIVGASGNTQLNITSGSGTFPFITLDQTGVVKYSIQNVATTGLFAITEAGVGNRLVIEKTSGNVGIGTDSPSNPLVVSSILRDYTSSEFSATFQSTTAQSAGRGGSIGLGGETGAGIVPFGGIVGAKENNNFGETGGYLSFLTRANGGSITEKVRILSSGGITFNGDTAAGNALDDYEEGTFTVSLTPATSGTISLNASYTTWTYTKIGRQVTVNGVAVISSVSSSVGAYVILTGLPFTIQPYTGAYGFVGCTWSDNSASNAKSAIGSWHSINETYLYLGIDASTIAASDEFYVTATYFV